MPCVWRQFEIGRSESGALVPFMVYAKFYAPKDILNSAWSDIVSCAIIAGKTVGIRTIITDPDGALGIFDSVFKSCLVAKMGGHADRIEVSLSTRHQSVKE